MESTGPFLLRTTLQIVLAVLACLMLNGCFEKSPEQRAARERLEAEKKFQEGRKNGYEEGYDRGFLEGEQSVKLLLLPDPGIQNGWQDRGWKKGLFVFAVVKTLVFLLVVSVWLVDLREGNGRRLIARSIMFGTGSVLAFSLAAKSGYMVQAVTQGVNGSLLSASPDTLLGEVLIWSASIVVGYLINWSLWKIAKCISDGLERAIATFVLGFVTSVFAWLSWKLAWFPDISRHVVFDLATGFMVGGLLHLGVRLHRDPEEPPNPTPPTVRKTRELGDMESRGVPWRGQQ